MIEANLLSKKICTIFTFNSRFLLTVAICLVSCIVSPGLQAAESNAIDLFVNPEKSFLWRTADTSNPVLSWETPSTAVSATLTVKSLKGDKTYDVSGNSVMPLQLEIPDSAADENVYNLTLTFNCGESNVIRRGQIGVVCGIGDTGAAGATVDIRPYDAKWNLLNSRKAVLPVMAGAEVLMIDNSACETALGGAAGWYGWKIAAPKLDREPYNLSLEMTESEWSADVILISRGFSLIIR